MTAVRALIDDLPPRPTVRRSTLDLFGFASDLEVYAFEQPTAHVPTTDASYRFNPDVTRAILAGFMHNRRVLMQGYHGTGKSSHIEQIAARLNWPCVRINLDSHVSRMDLIGRDAITVREGQQVTEFREGLLPWSLQRPVALVFDEYDAGRPDVMFVIQRVLEAEGRLTLLDQNSVLHAHPSFRLFATANTVGLGDPSGMYQGTNPINQGQLDRWHIVATLNYLPHDEETAMILARVPAMDTTDGRARVHSMVAMADLTRQGFRAGDLSTVMSPRTVISWAENFILFHDLETAFRYSFLNRCDPEEWPLLNEYYQRCFNTELHQAA